MAIYCTSRNRASGYSLRRLKVIADNYLYCSKVTYDGRFWYVCLYGNLYRSPYPSVLWSFPVKSKKYIKRLFNF